MSWQAHGAGAAPGCALGARGWGRRAAPGDRPPGPNSLNRPLPSLWHRSYTTSFRLRLARPEQAAVLEASLPEGLVTAGNLGAADVFPATSGKAGAALHLMKRWGMEPQDCVFMCGESARAARPGQTRPVPAQLLPALRASPAPPPVPLCCRPVRPCPRPPAALPA